LRTQKKGGRFEGREKKEEREAARRFTAPSTGGEGKKKKKGAGGSAGRRSGGEKNTPEKKEESPGGHRSLSGKEEGKRGKKRGTSSTSTPAAATGAKRLKSKRCVPYLCERRGKEQSSLTCCSLPKGEREDLRKKGRKRDIALLLFPDEERKGEGTVTASFAAHIAARSMKMRLQKKKEKGKEIETQQRRRIETISILTYEKKGGFSSTRSAAGCPGRSAARKKEGKSHSSTSSKKGKRMSHVRFHICCR